MIKQTQHFSTSLILYIIDNITQVNALEKNTFKQQARILTYQSVI